jgi:hypothetical protein
MTKCHCGKREEGKCTKYVGGGKMCFAKFTFTEHLYLMMTKCKNVNNMKAVSEEWDWWVDEYGIELNVQSWQEYADAVFFCKGLIEDYPK